LRLARALPAAVRGPLIDGLMQLGETKMSVSSNSPMQPGVDQTDKTDAVAAQSIADQAI
jgi:hypothetical protein